VLAGIAGWWFGYARYSREPGVRGLTRQAAITRLQAAHLHPVIAPGGAYSDDVPAGAVVRQSPGEGARVTHGQTVTLTLSLGPQLFAVPAVAPGTTTADASAQLAAAHLVAAHGTDVYSDTVPKGTVVSTDPPAGTQLRAGTPVSLALSRGPQPVTLPDATGADPKDLAHRLKDLKLKVARKEEASDTVPEGQVTRLDPASGQQVLPGSTVTMYVSTGPPFVDLPDVRGENIDDAAAQLEGLGFVVKTYAVFGDTVTEMSPSPGKARKGSTVRLLAGF
jgi:serine/threonine-protein kinase